MSLWSTTVLFTFVLATALTIKMLKSYHQLQLEKINVEKLNLQNELTLLKSQITPHFIFNTLNNIDELMWSREGKSVEEYISAFKYIENDARGDVK